MKFTISSKSLLTRFTAVSKVVKSKNTIAILNDFLFEVKGNMLHITGSDQDTRLTASVAIEEVEGEGSFALNVKKMLDMTKEMAEQNIEFNVSDNLEVDITYINGHYSLMAESGDNYPLKETEDTEKVEIEMPLKSLVDGINASLFAVGNDGNRPVMNGVYFDFLPEETAFVATDTHKLSRYRDLNNVNQSVFSFILPTKPASLLASTFEGEGNVKIVADSKGATFESESMKMVCSFIMGKYPKYNSVIPQDSPYTLTVDRELLQTAVRRVSVFADASGKVVFDINEAGITVRAQDLDSQSSGRESVNSVYEGQSMSIAFNKDRISEVLMNIECDTVAVKLSAPARPAVFLPMEQAENVEKVVLLMPMMI